MKKEFSISDRKVGYDYPPLIISEIGINHEGSLDLAIQMADAAIQAGAEVIKHQTHIVEDEMSSEAKNIIPGNADVSIYEIIKRCALKENDEKKLMNHVLSKGAIFISTPFSREAVKRLLSFNIPAFKIGSGECNNYPLIKFIAKAKKPVILSTGMNDINSISPAVKILRNAKIPFALLHCTNLYPTPPEFVRLGALNDLMTNFPDAVIGLSDHTTNNYACLGAVALGASILEKHFTDSKSRPGPDIKCSMDAKDLKNLIEGSKILFLERGGRKEKLKQESVTMDFAFSSVVAIKNINKGDIFNNENLWVRRPAGGDFEASELEGLFGKVAKNKIKKNDRLKREDVS